MTSYWMGDVNYSLLVYVCVPLQISVLHYLILVIKRSYTEICLYLLYCPASLGPYSTFIIYFAPDVVLGLHVFISSALITEHYFVSRHPLTSLRSPLTFPMHCTRIVHL